MKRDPDLIREIMFRVESAPGRLRESDLAFPGHADAEVSYHVQLLIEAGLVIGNIQYANNIVHYLAIERLTWSGHDFIEAARNDNAWCKAKEIMASTGGFVLELAKPLLLELIKGQLGLPGS